jgi:CheY-like chemotaxis protein
MAMNPEQSIPVFCKRNFVTQKTEPRTPVQILLVEDDDGDAKAVERAFATANLGNRILRAHDGVEAWDILKGSNGHARLEPPYMLLVDLNMPRMNGIQLVSAIREDPTLRDIVVFILSTSNRSEDKQAAHALKVTGYILKEKAGEDFLRLFSLVQSYWRIVELPLPKHGSFAGQ